MCATTSLGRRWGVDCAARGLDVDVHRAARGVDAASIAPRGVDGTSMRRAGRRYRRRCGARDGEIDCGARGVVRGFPRPLSRPHMVACVVCGGWGGGGVEWGGGQGTGCVALLQKARGEGAQGGGRSRSAGAAHTSPLGTNQCVAAVSLRSARMVGPICSVSTGPSAAPFGQRCQCGEMWCWQGA